MSESDDLHGRVIKRMLKCTEALGSDVIEHHLAPKGLPAGFDHRLVINGAEGPWVSKHAIAHNGIYCASHPYLVDEMPRVFFAIEIHPHTIRQPEARVPRSAPPVVSNPDPGDETGIETGPLPPSADAPGGGPVPRLDDDAEPVSDRKIWSPCSNCGSKTATHAEDCRSREVLEGCWRCGGLRGRHKQGCPRKGR